MARYDDNALEQVRQRADIVEIIGAHVRLRRTGRNFVGLCPFHNEKTPSFSVNPERGFFHCFGCGAGGTVFNFVMRMDGLTFPEAVRALASRYGVALPEQSESGPQVAEREAMGRANQVAGEFFSHVLWNTEEGAAAREYLKSRGITIATARAFMLGFAPARVASLAKALEKRNLIDAGLKLGLVKRDANGIRDLFHGRLVFPIRDVQGRAIAFGARVLDDRLPKYINSPESPVYVKSRTLYGLYEARQAIASRDRAIVVEGYFDVIGLWQAGFKEAVASCGTSLTVDQLRVLGRHTKNVMACFDGDAAGRKASMRALGVFLEAGLIGRGVFIPSGFDPDTFVKERGAQGLEDLIASAESLFDYFIREQLRESKASVAARARAAEDVAAMLKLVRNPFELDLLAHRAADVLGVGEDTLRRASRVSPAPGGTHGRAVSSPTVAPLADASAKAELTLIAIALLYADLRADLGTLCPPTLFESESTRALFADACALDTTGREPFEAFVAERLTAEQQGRIGEIAVGPMLDDQDHALKVAHDCIATLDRRSHRREVDELKRAAVLAPHESGDDAEAAAAAQAVIALKRRRDQDGRAGR